MVTDRRILQLLTLAIYRNFTLLARRPLSSLQLVECGKTPERKRFGQIALVGGKAALNDRHIEGVSQ